MGDKTFRPITDVEVVESVNAEDTVLIEQDGVAKRAPKDSIGAQSDWNETDESSPAFIKNKPDVSGGGGGVVWMQATSNGVALWNEDTNAYDKFISVAEFKELFVNNRLIQDNSGMGPNYDAQNRNLVVGYFINSSVKQIFHGIDGTATPVGSNFK